MTSVWMHTLEAIGSIGKSSLFHERLLEILGCFVGVIYPFVRKKFEGTRVRLLGIDAKATNVASLHTVFQQGN